MFTARMKIALVTLVVVTLCSLISTIQSFAHTLCTRTEFDCDRGKTCLPKRWLCDGEPDCRDATDELPENCDEKPSRSCSASEFTCASKKCIPKNWRCDKADDCGDNSDEADCDSPCKSTEFTCRDKQCITLRWRCDGMSDCSDGSDEVNCTMTDYPLTTPSPRDTAINNSVITVEYFYCDHGHRLPKSYQCDGDKDCSDESDEKDCNDVTAAPSELCLADREFQCSNTYCILKSWVCDGTADCQGAEDELSCPNRTCSQLQHTCANGECIPHHEKCNGFTDCRDKTDEDNCDAPKVEVDTSSCNDTTHFQCDTGTCIPRETLCNKVNDCGNSQDESEAHCGVDECEHNNGGCEHQCVNTQEAYNCMCNKGYRLFGKYTCEDINECDEVPGSCSQVCTNTKGSFHCSCLAGYLRDPIDYSRCKAAVGDAYLLFSHQYDIRSLRLRDRDMTSVVTDTRGATALDFHYNQNKILWSDRKEKKIFRADMNNTMAREVVVSGEEVSADGLAVDWIHSLIYYTDTSKFAVKLVSWDHKHYKTIATDNVGHPRAIAVSPMSGYVYWSDWGQEPKIERAGLDGSHREAIISQPHVAWPNGITIDHSADTLYWCDGRLNTISAARLDGSHIEVILFSPSVLRLPYSISVFEDRLYWTDWSQLALYSANKFNGNDVHNISAGYMLESPKVVHVFHQYRQPVGVNVCKDELCSHICVRSIYGEPICICPDDHYLMADTITCARRGVLPSLTGDSSAPDDTLITVRSPGNRAYAGDTEEELIKAITNVAKLESSNTAAAEETGNLGLIFGVIVGVLAGLALGFTLFITFTRLRKPAMKRLRFHNPVYRKTTEEDEPDDARGFTIAQEQHFYNPTRDYRHPDPTLTMTEADDAPLTPEDSCEA